jgi:hypothetical protein
MPPTAAVLPAADEGHNALSDFPNAIDIVIGDNDDRKLPSLIC